MIGHVEFFAIFVAAFCGTLAALPVAGYLLNAWEDFQTSRARRAYEREQFRVNPNDIEWDQAAASDPWPEPREVYDPRPAPDHVTLRPRGDR